MKKHKQTQTEMGRRQVLWRRNKNLTVLCLFYPLLQLELELDPLLQLCLSILSLPGAGQKQRVCFVVAGGQVAAGQGGQAGALLTGATTVARGGRDDGRAGFSPPCPRRGYNK